MSIKKLINFHIIIFYIIKKIINMHIMIVNGSNQSGKDNFVNFFIKHYEFKSMNLSTIDRVKEISKKYFGWDGKKNEPSRKFLSDIKRIWAEYNNGPFKYMVNKIKENNKKLSKEDKDNIVYFVHCREPEEIKKFKDYYKNKCYTILLKRDVRTEKNKISNNDSDMNVENYDYDKIVINKGNKMDLELESIKFLNDFKKLITNNQNK